MCTFVLCLQFILIIHHFYSKSNGKQPKACFNVVSAMGKFCRKIRFGDCRAQYRLSHSTKRLAHGSSYPTFTMDIGRTYLTVTLPVHLYFLPKVADNDKNALYQTKILEALGDKAMSENELAQAMGYKGISAKLSQAVETMLANGTLKQVPIGATVKICRK